MLRAHFVCVEMLACLSAYMYVPIEFMHMCIHELAMTCTLIYMCMNMYTFSNAKKRPV